MIKPTIGRVVWYYPYGHQLDQAHPALVAYVHSDTLVNLAAFDVNGNSSSATGVYLWNGEGQRPDASKEAFAEWMPYQKEQAARTEAGKPAADSPKSPATTTAADLLKK